MRSSLPAFRVGALCLLIAGVAPAQAQLRPARIDARLRSLRDAAVVQRIKQAPISDAAETSVRLRDEPLLHELTVKREGIETYVDVFVSLTDRSPSVIESLGGRIRSQAGSLFGAWLPLSAVARLESDPRVRFVESTTRIRVNNDAAMADLKADQVRTRTGQAAFTGNAGAGALVGIFDTGIDWSHADFKRADGTSRVLYLWDMTATSGTVPGTIGGQAFTRGNECTAAIIDAGSCSEQDSFGHGTHVAGIAAGNGGPTGTFAGVAPMADLIVVKGGNGSFSTGDVIEGIEYIRKRAAALGRPVAVNLSLGTIFAAHDGSSPEEHAIDSLSGPGRIVMIAAGNDAQNQNNIGTATGPHLVHATRTLGTSDTAQVALTISGYSPAAGPQGNYGLFHMWYDGRDSLTIAVQRPNGTIVSRRTGDAATGGDDPQGNVFMDNASSGPSPLNQDRLAILQLFDATAGQVPAAGVWRITVTMNRRGGNGRFDLWQYLATIPATFSGGGDNGFLVGSPATAARGIAVAAHTSRVNWTSGLGTASFSVRSTVGDLATFSSGGPARPYRDALANQKPDISAPGTAIFSTKSSAMSPAPNTALVHPDGVHLIQQGTSMSTPMVTGSVAVLLSRSPSLTPEHVRQILTTTARSDNFSLQSWTGSGGGVPNPSWGYGKVNLQAALAALPADLQIAAGPRNGSLGGIVVLPKSSAASLQLRVSGSVSDAIRITGLRLRSSGSGNDASGVTRVSLYSDADSNGVVGPSEALLGTATVGADNGEAIFSGLALTIPAGGTGYLLATYTFSSTPTNGQSFQLSLESASNVTAQKVSDLSGVSFVGSAVSGGTLTIQGVGTLVASQQTPAISTLAPGQPNAVLFRLDQQTSAIEGASVRRIATTLTGTALAASTLQNVRLIEDANGNGVVDAGDGTIGSVSPGGSSLIFDFAPPSAPQIAASSVRHWLIVGDVQIGAAAGGSLGLRVDSVRARGSVSDSTIVATGTPLDGIALALITSTFTISGASTDSLTMLRDAAALPLVRVRFTAQGEPMVVDSLRIRTAGTLLAAGLANLRVVADLDSNGVASTGEPVIASGLAIAAGGVIRVLPTPAAGAIPVGSRWWLLVGDGAGNATWGQTFQAHLDSSDVFVHRSSSGTTPVKLGSASILARLFRIGGQVALTVGPTIPTPSARLSIGSIPAIRLHIDANTLEGARVEALTIVAASNGAPGSFVDEIDLFANPSESGVPTGAPIASITNPFASGSAATFSSLGQSMAAGASATYLVVVKVNNHLRQGDTLGLSVSGIVGTGVLSALPATVTLAVSASALGGGTLLDANHSYIVSENPVRSGRVIFSYETTPRTIRIYNFAGLMVREFTGLPANHFEWDVRGETQGLPNGMYIVAVQTATGLHRQRLMLLSPSR
ncbi:MAG: S8 family serine peptidase [Gemmatimonadaceae bacterium]